MKKRSLAVTAAVLSLLSACSKESADTATGTGTTESPLSLKTIEAYSASTHLSGLRVTGTGLESVLTFSLNDQELYVDAIDDSSALLFYKELPDTGYQMLRAEAALTADSLPVIYRDSIVTFAGTTITWKGELAKAPTSPELNWTYFNTTTKTAYIFDGTAWSTLAVSGTDGVDGVDGTNGTNGTDGIDGTNGLNGLDGISIIWLGELAVHPETPAINNAYYNTADGISYIFNGTGWTVLAKDGKAGTDGIDGISIEWLGQFDTAPENPTINNAYYNAAEGISYIFDGNDWNILAKDGTNGTNGTDGVDGTNGTNGKDGKDGKDGINGIDGIDGISIVWKGELLEDPANPEINWAYYNTLKKASFIFDGTNWSILAKDGTDGKDGKDADGAGEDGVSIIWKGANDKHPATPELNWAYYNTTDGASYIFNGTSWNIITKDGMNGIDGKDGISIVWLGELTTAPADPSLNNAYYNTTEGISYIFNGTDWDILAKDGTDGTNGTNGVDGKDGVNGTNGIDGISLIWKGELASAPANPAQNWAYFNTANNNSYIYNGTDWDVFAKGGASSGVDGKDGKDGISIVWKGELAAAPSSPQLNWAYHNTTDGNSYIWNGSAWDMLAKGGIAGTDGVDGTNGVDGVSLIWKGSLATAPADPQLNWGYFNSTDYVSYIYSGSQWDTLAVSEKPVMYRIMDTIPTGDTLKLTHNLNADDLTFTAQYRRKGINGEFSKEIYSYEEYQPSPELYTRKSVESKAIEFTSMRPVLSPTGNLLIPGVFKSYPAGEYTLRIFSQSPTTYHNSEVAILALPESISDVKAVAVYGHRDGRISLFYRAKYSGNDKIYFTVSDPAIPGFLQDRWTTPVIVEEDASKVQAGHSVEMDDGSICYSYFNEETNELIAKRYQITGELISSDTIVEKVIYSWEYRRQRLFKLPNGEVLALLTQRNDLNFKRCFIIGKDGVIRKGAATDNAIVDVIQLKDGRIMAMEIRDAEQTILNFLSTVDGVRWKYEGHFVNETTSNRQLQRIFELKNGNICLYEHVADADSRKILEYDKYFNKTAEYPFNGKALYVMPVVDTHGTVHILEDQGSTQFYRSYNYDVDPKKKLTLRYESSDEVQLINTTGEELILTLAVNRGRSAN